MSSNSGRAIAAITGAMCGAFLLAGCATDRGADATPLAARLPSDQFPLRAEAHPDEIRLAAHPNGLSLEQRGALAAMLGRWRETGGGALTIRMPLHGADPQAAHETSQRTRDFLIAMGAPAERVVQTGYEPPAGPAPAPILVDFAAYEAVIPACGRSWENLSQTTKNRPSENFGCALVANAAAQIANPGDIAAPRATDPADAGRRTYVIDRYRQSESTAGANEKGASGAVSKTATQGGGN
jgi:pilus assembly protein CpaD